ncbi:MAG TPA: HD domain-containing protein [Alphaproteobacteria bacterium]|nr:HD domain-containing protein [Alphaproteobacteria bacterium]
MSIADEIFALYRRRGEASYGEGVTQNQHALQSAWLAEKAGARPELIVAALLHDIGHLLHDLPEDIAERGIDTRHERLASAWLSQHFGLAVSEPVRLHVDAKRYLCSVEPGYVGALSDASRLSLTLQGGPMSEAEARAFAMQQHSPEAVRLRRWDDEAKEIGLSTPDFAHFRPHLEAALKEGREQGAGADARHGAPSQ